MIIQAKIYIVSLSFVTASFFGCNFKEHSSEMEIPPVKSADNTLIVQDTILSGARDTLVLIKHDQAIIKGFTKANGHQPKYTLPVWQGDVVTAIVKPVQKNGNVRISQVQKPGGTFNGPYGDSLRYVVESGGNLHFIIGQNQMAGDPYTGNFILQIKVKQKGSVTN
ncbi:MAG: hypothetical protein ABIN94_01745 [Ferruginibacter sp.]